MEVCRATPSTPLRRRATGSPRVSGTPRASCRRRSLFREESDLSDVSPLSPSSEDTSPNKKVNSTPLRGVHGMSRLSLDSPVVRVHSEGIRMKGVRALDTESRAVIPPTQFYGSHTEPRPPRTWIRKQVSKAKTKLFLEDIPRDRKRARTSSGHKVQPPSKRLRTASRAPVPMLGQSRSGGKAKKKSSPSHKAKETPSREANTTSREANTTSRDENSGAELTRDFVTTEKDIEDIVGREIMRKVRKHSPLQVKEDNVGGNWEVCFTKESRLKDVCTTPTSDTSRKFFKSQANTTPKMVRRGSSALTPPWSGHKTQQLVKRRALCKPNYVFSPGKSSPLRRSPRKSAAMVEVVQSIAKDISEMLQDEPCLDTDHRVDSLLHTLHQSEAKHDWNISALPSPEEDLVEEPTTPCKPIQSPHLSESESKLYPIFRSGGARLGKSSAAKSKGTEQGGKYLGVGRDQYQIDSGQEGLREVQCGTCHMVYSKGCPEDEILHFKHHAQHDKLFYHGWKKERVVRTRDRDKVICVLKQDAKAWWNKVTQVVQLVDDYLGFPQASLDSLHSPQVYLYIKDKEVVGCLVAEQISRAHKLLSLEQHVDLCSSESYPASCGVSRIWVSPHHRRLSIATCLLDSLRANFAYGCILSKDLLAFTVPTDDGKKLISKYTGQDTGYLVYI